MPSVYLGREPEIAYGLTQVGGIVADIFLALGKLAPSYLKI